MSPPDGGSGGRFSRKQRLRGTTKARRGALASREARLRIRGFSDFGVDDPRNSPLARARVAHLEELARAAFERHIGRELVSSRSKPLMLPGCLNQAYAAEQRKWRQETARRLTKRHELRLARCGMSCVRLGSTILNEAWVVGEENLTKGLVIKLKKKVQRAAKRLPAGSLVEGMIDVCVERLPGRPKGLWAFHVHLTILIPVPGLRPSARQVRWARREVRSAFPYASAEEVGITRPVYSMHIPRRSDLSGWEAYVDKNLQFGGVRQHVTRRSGEPDKPRLTKRQEALLAGLLAQTKPDDWMVWVGYRRYGDRLVKMHVTDKLLGTRRFIDR